MMPYFHNFRVCGSKRFARLTRSSPWCRSFLAVLFFNLSLLTILIVHRQPKSCPTIIKDVPPASAVVHANLTGLKCTLNTKEIHGCFWLNNTQALIPFNAIKTEYELYEIVDEDSKTFHIFHSSSPVPRSSDITHDPVGEYMFFRLYDVERRFRVKLITADEGIPLSVQWNPIGYPYPIQIAQFGLSHFSKFVHLSSSADSSKRSIQRLLPLTLDLLVPSGELLHYSQSNSWLPIDDGNQVFKFSAPPSTSNGNEAAAVTMKLSKRMRRWRYFLLSAANWHHGSSVHLNLSLPSSNRSHSRTLVHKEIIYTCQALPSSDRRRHRYLSISPSGHSATFWMPLCETLSVPTNSQFNFNLSRDLVYDVLKAFGPTKTSSIQSSFHSDLPVDFTSPNLDSLLLFVDSIEFRAGAFGPDGGGYVRNMFLGKPAPSNTSLASVDLRAERLFHYNRFLSAVDWFVRHQKEDGTWRIPIKHQLRGRPALQPGWPSAMAQGHGLSLLSRAYHLTRAPIYLESVRRALLCFNRTVSEGGILSYVLDQRAFPWFEEYPSEPGNHVLNGFIFSLIGLYDLLKVTPDIESRNYANRLWSLGLNSLSTLLPLFDSGTGSFYNLFHLTMFTSTLSDTSVLGLHGDHNNRLDFGPNRARWSYHALHVQQLMTLALIDPIHSAQWYATSTRWAAYMRGLRSPHN